MKMVMPKMGMTMEEGTIVEWKKEEGEHVEKGEIILEIMTNKVNIDVEAPASGYLKILKFPDQVAPVGEVIALIEESAEVSHIPAAEVSVPVTESREKAEIAERKRIPVSPRARRLAEERGISLEQITGTGPDGAITEEDVLRIGKPAEAIPSELVTEPFKPEFVPAPSAPVSPLAERIAREKGVDLSNVEGTGLGGKITKEDVLEYVESAGKVKAEPVAIEPEIPPAEEYAKPVPAVPEAEPTEPAAVEVKEVTETGEVPEVTEKAGVPEEVGGIPLTGIRKLTADRMSKSKREAPHLTLGMNVDMTEATKLKDSLNVTYTDIIVRATALALKKHPIMNSTLKGDKIVLRDQVNIGIAVARGDDLLVPVIHAADNLSLKEISFVTRDLVERTRNDQLTEKDVLDGTFTVSNLGMYGISFFTPIINPPEAAILGVGEITKTPVVIDNQIRIREQLILSLSFDHRIVNGMPASLFLKEIKTLVEHPYKLLVEGEP